MSNIKELVALSKSFSLLYVEDDLNIRDNYAKIFSDLFSLVEVASDGQDGLEKYKKRGYDIVITDINMPKMNGISMIEKILEINPEQTIIVTSAHDESHYLMQLIDLGIEKLLLKPLYFKKMISILHKTCKHLNEQKELKEYQERIEDENLRIAKLINELEKKNKKLQNTVKKLTRNENINIALLNSIENKKKLTKKEISFYTQNIKPISAEEFVSSYGGDIDTLNDNLEMIEETLELIIHQKTTDPSPENIQKLSTAFYNYGQVLKTLYRFNNLAEALESFSMELAKIEDLNRLKEMKSFLFGIADSLQKWRKNVLIDKTAKDIHFLDNSIISDCMQTQSMLSSSFLNDDEEIEDIFF